MWRVVVGCGAAVALAYGIANYFQPSDSIGSDLVLLLTAWVVIWYAAETAELRKQGERRAEIEAEPVVGFVLTPQAVASELWCKVRNYTRNAAVLRVLVRLKTSAGLGRFQAGPYSGNLDWLLHEFQGLDGHFSLLHLVASVQGEEMKLVQLVPNMPVQRISWPAESKMRLDIQLAVYDAARHLRRVVHQEYCVTWASQESEVAFWPEIAPTLDRLPWPTILPNGKVGF